MTPDMIFQMVLNYGVVPALLVFLVYSDRGERKSERAKSQEREERLIAEAKVERDKSQDREDKLMFHIGKADANMSNFASSLEKIGDTMNSLDKSLCYLQRDVEDIKAKNHS